MANRLRLIKLLVKQMCIMDKLFVRLQQCNGFSSGEESEMLIERENTVNRIFHHLETLDDCDYDDVFFRQIP
jgi:hypothetical protein